MTDAPEQEHDYTVVLKDYSEHKSGITRVVRAGGRTPEHAAGEAECGLAIEVWERRYPGIDHLEGQHRQMDDEWIACMEAVATLAVIEGRPTVWFEDGIYFPDTSQFVLRENTCEGCSHCLFPGIRWPASPDGAADRSYVDRCDYCERYESDEAAAKFLAAHFGVRWGWANRYDPEAEVRWEPAEDDGLDYYGFSCVIDHEARDDGGPQWLRPTTLPTITEGDG